MLTWLYHKAVPLIDFCFPVTCLGCHSLLTPREQDLCVACWMLFSKMKVSTKLLGKRVGWKLDNASAALYFSAESRVQSLLHGLKYHYNPGAALRLGRWYGQRLLGSAAIDQVEVILPVPLHPIRAAARGYNQIERLAEGIAQVLDRPCRGDWLIRVRHTALQSQQSAKGRAHNVANGFALSSKAKVKGSHVLLVDDLVTSGETILACIKPLAAAQVGKISLAVLALTQQNP